MKHLIHSVIILFLACFFSSSVFAQRGYYEQDLEMPFQPRFILGSSYYNSQGDISGAKTGNLLGNIGFKSGVRFNIDKNTDLSLLFSRFKLAEETYINKFTSELRSFGLHFDYTFYNIFKDTRISPFVGVGLQSLSYKSVYWNENNIKEILPSESSFALPVNAGISLDVSERIRLDLSLNYIMNFSDIDHDPSGNSDNMVMLDFSLYYDFFTLIPRKKPIDDSFYSDINFKEFEVEDSDGDLVPDMEDDCPETPQGVEVDEKGCPLDTDNDGIPNYLDKEISTRFGALVDEDGVELTAEKYESIYGYIAASRKYALVYNQSEIKKEDYANVNDYLVAKANEFNKNYNESIFEDEVVQGIRYKVQIGEYSSDVPEEMEIKMLTLNDVESTTMGDYVIYMVGSYSTKDDALKREYALDMQGFNDCYLLVDNNGKISKYVPPAPKNNLSAKSDELKDKEELLVKDTLSDLSQSVIISQDPVYRVQIGAFKEPLPLEVFVGVENVISMKDRDGYIRYMTGSFSNKKEGIDYMFQMRARGFEDAFLVSYQDGDRIIEYFVPVKKEVTTTKKDDKKIDKKIDKKTDKEIYFVVQILVSDKDLTAEEVQNMSTLGDVEKKNVGVNMFVYNAGSYDDFMAAESRLMEAKKAGFQNAFILATVDGNRVTVAEAKNMLK